jgi:hypothetical protein
MPNPLFCIICGYERGGTTLVSELLRQHPGIDGRFEGGFLLAKNLAEFVNYDPYAANVKRFWGISQADLEYICQADAWMEGYKRLIERSNIPNKDVSIYDKTPLYMQYLGVVLKKVDVPAICVVRDPRALFWSHKKRWPETMGIQKGEGSGTNKQHSSLTSNLRGKLYHLLKKPRRLKKFVENYLRYASGWQDANRLFPNRILLVQHEELCTHPFDAAKRIYNFLELRFKEAYLFLPQTSNQYVGRTGIRDDVVWEYRSYLSEWEQHKLLRSTRAYADWHWHHNQKTIP